MTECFDNILMAIYEESAFCLYRELRKSPVPGVSERGRKRFDRKFGEDYAALMGARRRFAIDPKTARCSTVA